MRTEGVLLATTLSCFLTPPHGQTVRLALAPGTTRCSAWASCSASRNCGGLLALSAAELPAGGVAGDGRVRAGKGRARLERLRIAIMEDVVRRVSDPGIIYHKKEATIGGLEEELRRMRERTGRWVVPEEAQDRGTVCRGAVVEEQLRPPHQQGGVDAAALDARAEQALRMLQDARVVAVLRGGHPERLIQRGQDLAALPGCGAIEVALDSPGALGVLQVLAPSDAFTDYS